MKSYKLWIGLVVFLMLVNIGLLGLLWYNNLHSRKPDIKGSVFEYLTRELKLTPAQTKQYDAMRQAHFELTRRLNEETRLTRDSFFNQIKSPTITADAINAMAKRISTGQASVDTATFYHFRRFRAILKPEQQARFDQVINDVLHMMANRGGKPGQRGPGGRPQPAPNLRPPHPGDDQQAPMRPDSQMRGGKRPQHLGPPDGPPDDMGPPPPGTTGPDGKPLRPRHGPPPNGPGPDGMPPPPPAK